MPTRARVLSLLVPIPALLLACGGGALPNGGQSSLINKTFAGQNRCSAENHDRPFIVEWDATDQSSFQARATNDVIVVKYEGCDLQVLDGCSADDVKGALGSYKPVTWTAGQLETIDISDENELYAKLPLGAASLDGRVQQGEKFHMEYYVSGTRTATREAIYRAALDKIPACRGATHFVYAYNLGAFALASASNLKAEVNGSYFGFGAGGTHASESSADKKGGDLAACTKESAKEVESCKVPIRLTLRAIADGDDPQATAANAPETDKAANLAGQIKSDEDKRHEAQLHADAAREKGVAHDGAGCIAELDLHDQLDPRPETLSTNPASVPLAGRRAQCLMMSGQCEAGRELFRKFWERGPGAGQSPAQMDQVADTTVGQFCTGASMSTHDRIQAAKQKFIIALTGGQVSAADCAGAYQTLKDTHAIVAATENDDPDKVTAISINVSVPKCFANASDCATAFSSWKELDQMWRADFYAQHPPAAAQQRTTFENVVPSCKGK